MSSDTTELIATSDIPTNFNKTEMMRRGERFGDVIRFNHAILDLAAHYRLAPRPVVVARGNQKGRVERAISYIRQYPWLSPLAACRTTYAPRALDWRPRRATRSRAIINLAGTVASQDKHLEIVEAAKHLSILMTVQAKLGPWITSHAKASTGGER